MSEPTASDSLFTVDPASLKTDPRFSGMFPIDSRILESIANSMRSDGYHEGKPIFVWRQQNVVVDGHTRLEAAIQAGVNVRVQLLDFTDEEAAIKFARECQKNRRNQTDADLFREALALHRERKRGTRTDLAPSGAKSGKSAEVDAGILGTSTRHVERMRTIIDHGPGTHRAILDGMMTINAAYDATRAKLKPKLKPAAKVAPSPVEAPPPPIEPATAERFLLDGNAQPGPSPASPPAATAEPSIPPPSEAPPTPCFPSIAFDDPTPPDETPAPVEFEPQAEPIDVRSDPPSETPPALAFETAPASAERTVSDEALDLFVEIYTSLPDETASRLAELLRGWGVVDLPARVPTSPAEMNYPEVAALIREMIERSEASSFTAFAKEIGYPKSTVEGWRTGSTWPGTKLDDPARSLGVPEEFIQALKQRRVEHEVPGNAKFPELAEFIVELLNKSQLSGREMAAKLDVAESTFRAWKSGESWPGPASHEKLIDLARELDVEHEQIPREEPRRDTGEQVAA